MKITKTYFFGTAFSLLVLFSSCDPVEVADIQIRYEVIATNPDRPYNVTYSNITNGNDIANNQTDMLFSRTFFLPSDVEPSEFFINVFCEADFEADNPPQQSITTRIFEDNVLIQERTVAGSGTISASDTDIFAILPTSIKYED